ncbi:MAG TPA: prepilin-type N-terminal cleavage/methylation domain-containing protein [Tepidisphaeraceae bacterium]
MMSKPTRPAAGFTLVEILIVVVILGIASAVIVPKIGTRDDLKASAAARMVMADLIYAQNRAIAQQKKQYVQFDTAAQKYAVYDATPLATPITHPVTKNSFVTMFGTGGTPGLTESALASVNFDGQTTVAFDELGQPLAYTAATNSTAALGTGTIVVRCGSNSLTISIEAYTGEISVN